MEKFDAIIIGGGSAGYAAARTIREKRQRVAIIDHAPELGGLCILRGCMPSKTLIYSTEVLHHARHASLFGLDIPEARADMKLLHDRKVRLVRDFQSYRQGQLESDRFHLIRERAAFISENEICLDPSGEILRADTFVVATGSVVNHPPVPGIETAGIWTSDDVLDLDFLPQSVIVLGGGVVACELVQFLNRIGSKVTQIQRSPQILKEISLSASAVLMEVFRKQGIDLHTGTHLECIEKTEKGFCVRFHSPEGEHKVDATHVLNALGRRPALDGLNLETAGVKLSADGKIKVNEFQQTDNPRIYAAGDVAGPYEIVHLAIMQGETAGQHAIGLKPEPVNRDTRTEVIFTDPQIALAGLTLQEANSRGFELEVAEYLFEDHGKAMLMEAHSGYVKVWADKDSGRVIGAECVGRDAGELIHAMAVAISLKATVNDLLKVHWYHPTLSEIWTYPLEDIAEAISPNPE